MKLRKFIDYDLAIFEVEKGYHITVKNHKLPTLMSSLVSSPIYKSLINDLMTLDYLNDYHSSLRTRIVTSNSDGNTKHILIIIKL